MLAILLAAVLWGTTGTAASSLSGQVSPVTVGAATMGLGGALLFATAPRGAFGVLRDVAARRWVLFGAAGVVVYPLAFYSAMQLSGVAIGNVVSLGSAPVFAAVLEWAWERRRVTVRWLLATVVALTGILLLAAAPASRPAAAAPPAAGLAGGIALGLLAGLSYALYTYSARRMLQRVRAPRGVLGAIFGVAALPLILILVASTPVLPDGPGVLVLTYLILGPMLLAYLLFERGLRRVSSSTATTLTLLEPVVATALAVGIVGERLPPMAWVGIGLILGAVAILVWAGRGGNRA